MECNAVAALQELRILWRAVQLANQAAVGTLSDFHPHVLGPEFGATALGLHWLSILEDNLH